MRQGTREEMALYVQSRGQAVITAGGGVFLRRAGELGAVDVTSPYTIRQLNDSDNNVLLIEFARLGLPVDMIRAAIPSLEASPIYRLVQGHLLRLAVDLPADAGEMTGQATTELVAALISTVTGDPRGREATEAAAPRRVAAYIDERLGDAGLTTGQIAAAHGMSARRLTAAWKRSHGVTPADWIARRRLERARRLLADPCLIPVTIEDIAYACGFGSVAGFGRQFRAAYEMSPQEFRIPRARLAPSRTSGAADADPRQ